MCPSHEIVEVISGFSKSGTFMIEIVNFPSKLFELFSNMLSNKGTTVDRKLKGHYQYSPASVGTLKGRKQYCK
jgi:hypothetical protein